MTIRNIFNRGAQDKDSDKSAVINGMTRHVENLRFHTNNGKDGVGVNIKGTIKVSDVTEANKDLKCIGAYFNEDKDVIYYKLASTDGMISIDAEYNINLDTTSIVLKDTNGVLKYDKKGYITGWNEIDGLQFWSEWGNNPRRINTERAKQNHIDNGANSFTEDDIMVAVIPPLQKLKITLNNVDIQNNENKIEDVFLCFSSRFRYLDGEYSSLAPFTNVAFMPNDFDYNFSEQSNRSMINKYNNVIIEFFTGNERVTEIQIVFKESESNNIWIIQDFVKKTDPSINHNEIKSFNFANNKTYRALSKNILPSLFNNVPHTAKSQSIIEGRLIYGNYIEYYDIKDCEGKDILIDFKLNLLTTSNSVDKTINTYDEFNNLTGTEVVTIPSKIPKKTCKSIRDYEVGVVYGDNHGRVTSILNSLTNTLSIPVKNSVTENKIQVELINKPPCWATHYKFFIKQDRRGYDYILPTLFYEDGSFIWVKLEGAEIDKIKKNTYIIVKSDTESVLERLIKLKVLEVKEQKRDFLALGDMKQEPGFYFKIEPENTLKIDLSDFNMFSISSPTYRSEGGVAIFSTGAEVELANFIFPPKEEGSMYNIHDYISQAHFYGDTLDDMETNSIFDNGESGIYTGSGKARYTVTIDGNISGVDTFTVSVYDVNGNNTQLFTNQPITMGVFQDLSDGVKVKFENESGHSLADTWTVNARSSWNTLHKSRAYAFFRTTTSAGQNLLNVSDEIIYAGARIVLKYSEFGRGSDSFRVEHESSVQYDNIQEWFYNENIISEITSQSNIQMSDIHFMRGHFGGGGGIQDDVNGTMTMCIRTREHGTWIERVKASGTTEVIQNDSGIILTFETEPKKKDENIYFEIGKNYKIINGLHSHITDDLFETNIEMFGSDQSQTETEPLKVTLDWFNAFSYGNGIESYKIRDDYNSKGIDVGVRPLTNTKEEYKQIHRDSGVIWSDVYNNNSSFNGLNTFNLTLLNFITLDKEDGSIQKLFNANKNLLVYQEDAIGLMPYNRSVIEDVEGGRVVGISKNILNKDSYRPYADGLHGISLNPESFVAIGSRKYSTDRVRGDLLRLSIDGVTEINKYQFEHWFSDEMHKNKGEKLISGYDPKHKEYYLFMPKTGTLVFTEKAKGFPFFLTIEPDFMLNANNEFYTWKNGIMYRMNATENRNNFFGTQYNSIIKFFVNAEYQTEKIFKALGLESTHAWLCKIKTTLTSREIPKESFSKKEDYFYSEIMGNTNDNTKANSVFGIGSYPIVNGVITMRSVKNSLSVGDTISSKTLSLPTLQITDIQGLDLILSTNVDFTTSFLMYHKNQNIDGSPIRGDILEVEMTSDETEKTEIRAVRTEVSKSSYS